MLSGFEVSRDGQWIVSGSKDRGVQFWDARSAEGQCRILGHKNSVISVDLSPMGGLLATGSGDWQARICMHVIFSPCNVNRSATQGATGRCNFESVYCQTCHHWMHMFVHSVFFLYYTCSICTTCCTLPKYPLIVGHIWVKQ